MFTKTLIIDKRKERSIKYKRLLENKKNSVYISNNFADAMQNITDFEPDLIIISDSMDENLAEICEKIRILTYNMRPVIVTVSKSAELADKLQVLKNGADDYISEPINNDEFKMRIYAHLRREQESGVDTKTLLPNKSCTMRAIKRALNEKNNRTCLLISLENLKIYKDIYSWLAADKLVQTYCAIINSTLAEDDYFGVLSENEFILITSSVRAEKIASFLVFAFDAVNIKFYSQEDARRGYMILQDDESAGRRCEFVSTIIGVADAKKELYNDVQSMLYTLNQVHTIARTPAGSNYAIDRTKLAANDSIVTAPYNRTVAVSEEDEALLLLLKTTLELQGYDVVDLKKETDFMLAAPAVIIIDAGDAETQNGLELCKKIKMNKFFSNTKIIVTSVLRNKEVVLNTGADLYLPKPYELSNLIRWVEFFIKEVN